MSRTFSLSASWEGALEGNGTLSTQGLEARFSVPVSLGGAGAGTNPEELLLGAASSCFLITLAAVLQRRKIAVSKLEIRSELEVDFEGGLRAKRIRHFPSIKLTSLGEGVKEGVLQAVDAAEANCLVAKALSGNIAFEIATEIL